MVILVLAISGVLTFSPRDLAANGGFTPPPDRNGPAPGLGDNVNCPPGPDASTKGDPDAGLGDSDVNGDGSLDYFMGEYKFIEGDKDLLVRKWCINLEADEGNFNDFFTFELITSLREPGGEFEETVRVEPGAPT
jgi:hypothetical protein